MTFATLALTERIRSTFRTAFSGVKLGNGISIRQSEATDNYSQGISQQQYRDLPAVEVTSEWERIPLQELERAASRTSMRRHTDTTFPRSR
jgi:hypothetical protein